MHKILSFSLVLVFSFLFVQSCDSTSVDPKHSQENLAKGEGLIPTAIGNTWFYVDSVWWTEESLEVANDTAQIVDTVSLEGEIWWQLNGGLPSLDGQFMVRNDSVFSRQIRWNGQPFPSLEYIPPPDTLVEYLIFRGDMVTTRSAVISSEPIRLAVGLFDSTGIYTYRFAGFQVHTIIAPGYGILRRTTTMETTLGLAGPVRSSSTLTDWSFPN